MSATDLKQNSHADEGPHPVEGEAAGVLEVHPACGIHTCLEIHLVFSIRACSTSMPLRHVVGARVRAVAAGLVGAVQVVADDRRPVVALRGVGHQIFLKHFGLGRPGSDRGERVRSAFQVRQCQGASTLTSSSSRHTPGLSCLAQPTLQRC